MEFSLDARLEANTFQVTELSLCRVLLMNDNRYPWFILVPRRGDVCEFHHLAQEDRSQLMREITQVSETLEKSLRPDKINVGALGNIVNQLHIHVLGRFVGDFAWPGPVWGMGEPAAYDYRKAARLVKEFRGSLGVSSS